MNYKDMIEIKKRDDGAYVISIYDGMDNFDDLVLKDNEVIFLKEKFYLDDPAVCGYEDKSENDKIAYGLEMYLNYAYSNLYFGEYRCRDIQRIYNELMGKDKSISICPFCGRDKTKVIRKKDKYYVICNCCHSKGGVKSSEEEAIDLWNSRLESFVY